MTSFGDEYKKTVMERSDAFMKHVAMLIAEEQLKEFERLEAESKNKEIPPQLDAKIQLMIKEFEKKERRKVINKRLKAMGKIVAVVVLCLAMVSAVLVVTVDAVRVRVLDFFLIDHGEYMDVKSVESGYLPDHVRSQLPEDWESVFYPAVLPEGYDFEEAYKLGNVRTLLFRDGEDNLIFFTYNPDGAGQTMVDSEESQINRTDINGNPAVYSIREDRLVLHWSEKGMSYDML
ncbi:MAG: DUF4367 domain-containing protein [Parabacteroides sp.]|nr:DUF4367 domain-containing protein [Parabacteroides sp.]